MEFSFDDFKNGMTGFVPPKAFVPYVGIDPRKYQEYKEEDTPKSLAEALEEIEKRVDHKYHRKLIPLAQFSISYAADVFPAFDLFYSEMIADDWLSMVGWQKFQRDHLVHQPLTAYTVYKMLRGWNGKEPFKIGKKTLLQHCVDAVLFNEESYYLREYLVKWNTQKIHGKQPYDFFLLKQKGLLVNQEDKILTVNDEKRFAHPLYRLWELLFTETAYVAAMFHDIGYPWQYVQRLSKSLPHTKNAVALHYDGKDITTENFRHRLLYVVLNGYQSKGPGQPIPWDHVVEKGIDEGFRKTHGLPGAFTFLLLNDVLRDFPQEKNHTWFLRQFVIEWAAVAICMHDLMKVYRGEKKDGQERNGDVCPGRPSLQVSFAKDPLSAVLCLADFMQDFERHSAIFDKSGKKPTLSFERKCHEVSLEMDYDVAKIVFYHENASAKKEKQHFIRKEKDDFFSPSTGYLDFSACGIAKFDISAEVRKA